MRINFQLATLDDSWLKSESWLVHTDGCYWVDVKEERLFETITTEGINFNSADVDTRQPCGIRTYVGEFLLRLLEVSPYALEPIPPTLEKYLSVDELPNFFRSWAEWLKEADSKYDIKDPIWNEHDIATTWLAYRVLDCDYLPGRPQVWLWCNNQQEVHWGWNFTQANAENGTVYTATHGMASESSDMFKQSVSNFACSLFDEIERSSLIPISGARKSVLESLYQNLRKQPRTNWLRVQAAIKKMPFM